MIHKTYSQKPAEVVRKWHVIDATDVPLGRLSTVCASLILGKGKPTVTPHTDGGDFVVVINADHIKVTGDKSNKKMYYSYSGYPGGLTETTLKDLQAQDSTKIITKAVYGMIPANKLKDARMQRLKVYSGDQHGHEPQKPEVYTIRKDK